MKTKASLVLVLVLTFSSFGRGQPISPPGWINEAESLKVIFDSARVLPALESFLSHWQLAFTSLGAAAVFVSAVLRVAKAKNGEESLGWVASTLAAGALMVAAPGLGSRLYQAADNVAEWSGYDRYAAVDTCWNSFLLVCPSGSPATDAIQTGQLAGQAVARRQAHDPEPPSNWILAAWIPVRTVVAGLFAAISAITDNLMTMAAVFVPAVCWFLALLAVLLGEFVRQVLFNGLGAILPAMIGLLTFAPTRGVASGFLLKYASVAFWPAAWALGNALSVPLAAAVARWALAWASAVSHPHLAAPEFGAQSISFVADHAAYMGWGLLLAVSATLTVIALMQILSAIVVPFLLSALLSKGASLIGAVASASVALYRESGSGTGGDSASILGANAGARRSLARSVSGMGDRLSGFSDSEKFGAVAGAGAQWCRSAAGALDRGHMSAGETMTVSASEVGSPSTRVRGIATMRTSELRESKPLS